jgi:hypothetical protein
MKCPASKKAVSFSTSCEVTHVSRPTADEIQEWWYSIEDVGTNMKILARHANHCSRMLIYKSKHGLAISEDERVLCVGIEHLLSKDAKKNVLALNATRKSHVYTVLTEQARQEHCQCKSVEELGRVSEQSSHSQRQRAHRIAVMLMPGLS